MARLYEIPRHVPPRALKTLKNFVKIDYPSKDNVWIYTSFAFYFVSSYSFRVRLRIMVPVSDLAQSDVSTPNNVIKVELTVYSLETESVKQSEAFIFRIDPKEFDYDDPQCSMVQDMVCHTVVPLSPLECNDIKIPQTIIQTSTTGMVNFKLYSACMSLVDQNPDFEYIFMDNQDIDDFVASHYHSSVVEIFRSVIPGAYKADVFRYMYLHIYGGFYFDCKIIAKTPILSVVTAQDGDLIVCKDRPYGALYNAVIFAQQGHPDLAIVLKEGLSRLNELKASSTADETNRVLCKYGIYGITGPALLWQVLSPQILEGTLLPRLLYSKSSNMIHRRTKEKEPAYVHRPDVWPKEHHQSAIFLVPYYRDYYFDYKKIHGDISYKEHFFQKTIIHKQNKTNK